MIYLDKIGGDYYKSTRHFTFQNLFVFNTGITSISVGLGFISDKVKVKEGFIDFNPNKIFGSFYNEYPVLNHDEDIDNPFLHSNNLKKTVLDILETIKSYSHEYYVLRYDLAVDIPCSRTDIFLIKDRRKYLQFRKSNEDITEYLGARSSAGYVKIYNKMIESELTFKLTRIEVTETNFNYDEAVKEFPDIYFRCNDYSDSVLFDCLNYLPVDMFNLFFSRLNYRTRQKYITTYEKQKIKLNKASFKAITDNIFNLVGCKNEYDS